MAAVEPFRPYPLEARGETSRDTVAQLVDALGPISPELALVDPQLAARARALPPDVATRPRPERPLLESPIVHSEPKLPSVRAAPEPAREPEFRPETAKAGRRVSPRTIGGVAVIGVLVAITGAGVWKGPAALRDGPQQAAAPGRPLLFSALPTDPSLAPDAIAKLERQARRQPRSAAAREALGTAYLRLRRWSDAERELRALVALAPNDYFAHFALGRALEERGRRSEAARHFTRANALTGG